MEKFFSIVVGNDSEVEIIEFISRRYNNTELIMKLPIERFADFMRIAREKEQDEFIHAQWTVLLPDMSKGYLKYMSFEHYKEQCTGKHIDFRSSDEIIKELEELHGKKLL